MKDGETLVPFSVIVCEEYAGPDAFKLLSVSVRVPTTVPGSDGA